MLPIRLNLLSPDKKHHLKRMALFIFFKNILEIILIIVAVAGVIFIGGRWFLQNYFNDLTEHLVSVGNQKNDTSQRIRHINFVLKDLSLMQKEYQPWTPVIVAIANSIPAEISLDSLVLDRNTNIFTFTGLAKTRADLLNFQDKLQELPFITKVELPLSQLTEKEHIPFIITATVK
jgi:Tfp pilus assembly protein PilN